MDVAPTTVRSPGRQIALRSAMEKATGMGCARRILDGAQPDIDTITFSTSAELAEGDDPVSIEFATVPFRC
jgi:hypothetical protein